MFKPCMQPTEASPSTCRAQSLYPLRPLKLLTTPAEPPLVTSEAQFQVPVHAPLPQLMATRCAPLLTATVFLDPVKLTPYV